MVAISHLHADHLHLPSLKRLPAGTLALVPMGAQRLLDRLPLRVREVQPGDRVNVGPGVSIEVVPARHDDQRYPGSRLRATPVGYVVRGARRTFFPGDTELDRDALDAVGSVDIGLVPVGGWGPTLGAGHMDPAQGAALVRYLRLKVAIPVHWGTFWPAGLRRLREALFHEPGDRFVEAVADASPATQVRLLEPGKETVIDGPL